ncbi:response regulator transcription factor [bacterium]|nr:response regulator transcription factor [bacterium]NUN45830.1 response regulator transcription factor [bacterium]
MIRIAMIEDDAEIRQNVTAFLKKDNRFTITTSAGSVEEDLEAFKTHTPDILILDIGLPGMSGLSAIRLFREKFPDTDIVMFTVHDDPARIFEALCNGASGYLIKNTPFADIARSLDELHNGGAPMSPQIARKVIQHFYPAPSQKPQSTLSDKEKEVVVGLVDGLSYKMIADRMDVTIETIRSHIKNIYRKLHVHSKAEVITKSLRGEI